LIGEKSLNSISNPQITQMTQISRQDPRTYKIIGAALEKKYRPDFICFDEIIVELKALEQLSGIEEAQIINYLKASGLRISLLINFGSKSLEYKRFVYNY